MTISRLVRFFGKLMNRIKMEKEIDINDFCDYIIDLFAYKGEPLTHKKLHKILYYVQAWHLVYFKGKLIFNEPPQAWVHGAVYPSIYLKYKHYKYEPIIPKSDVSIDTLNNKLKSFNISEQQKQYLESVLNYYGSKSAIELEILVHYEPPYKKARKELKEFEKSNNVISFFDMKEYYSSIPNN